MIKEIRLKDFEERHQRNLKNNLTCISMTPFICVGQSYINYDFEYGIKTEFNQWKVIDSFTVIILKEEIKDIKFDELFNLDIKNKSRFISKVSWTEFKKLVKKKGFIQTLQEVIE